MYARRQLQALVRQRAGTLPSAPQQDRESDNSNQDDEGAENQDASASIAELDTEWKRWARLPTARTTVRSSNGGTALGAVNRARWDHHGLPRRPTALPNGARLSCGAEREYSQMEFYPR